MGRSLVLNASFQPLAVVPAKRAVVLVLKDKAVIVESNGVVYRSERLQMPAPSVVRLKYLVHVPYRDRAALTRRAVFARDDWRCQYCGAPAENVDHVVPKSRGGLHAWENVVAACAKCNHSKGDKTPAELGWRLHAAPAAPRGVAWRVLGHRTPDPRWADWLDLPASEAA